MTIHPESGYLGTDPSGPLREYLSYLSGAWQIISRPHRLGFARSFLGGRSVESFLLESEQVVTEADPATGDPEEGILRGSGDASGRAPTGRGGFLEVDCGDGSTLILKPLRRGGLPAKVRGGYHGRSRLLAEMSIIEEAVARGIPTAPLAFGALGRRDSGAMVGVLATERIPGAFSLGALLEGSSSLLPERGSVARRKDDPAGEEGIGREAGARRAALAAAGAVVARAHDAGLDHVDLNIGNVLLQRVGEGEAWRAYVIDLGLSTLGEPLEHGRRASNLVRLLRSAEKHLGGDPRRARDAAAFMKGYLKTLEDPERTRRRDLLTAVRRRLPSMMIHRLGWRLLGRG